MESGKSKCDTRRSKNSDKEEEVKLQPFIDIEDLKKIAQNEGAELFSLIRENA